MDKTPEILFEYLKNIIYSPRDAVLDTAQLSQEYQNLGEGLKFLKKCLDEQRALLLSLAKGDLSAPLPPADNELAAPLKSLQASLRHMTWQSQQVAKGDYTQRIDFMGEFAEAFNTMIDQLDFRRTKLENEITASEEKNKALVQSNELLTNITENTPQALVVADGISLSLLYSNKAADRLLRLENELIRKLTDFKYEGENGEAGKEFSVGSRYYEVYSYNIQWDEKRAAAFVLNDISESLKRVGELEVHAYHDSMTGLHNRLGGMKAFNDFLEENREFTLVFVDLDNLKHVNDNFGHEAGDKYIICAGYELASVSGDGIAARLGGDEFMLLLNNTDHRSAELLMENTAKNIGKVPANEGLPYSYSISFGTVHVKKDNKLSPSEILSIADSRMYEHKRENKMKNMERKRQLTVDN
ncbi:MAG: diguanylate cyclase [Oscillospiraceae bacterium]|jgi:diguanylate cyclase (GGDEF)-like protein|nr:diguanylate cyclase [Oscillospiraceae bacterium]